MGDRKVANWETSRFPTAPARSPFGSSLRDIGAPAPATTYAADLKCIVAADGRILHGDRAAPTAGDERATASSIFDFAAPDQHETVRIALKRVFTTGVTDGYECRGQTPYAADAWYECRLTPNHHEGKIVSATLVARDITRWLRAEDRLRRERDHLAAELMAALDRKPPRGQQDEDLARFRGIVDQAGEAIFLTDPATGRLVDANDTACSWVGMTREKLCSLRTSDLELEFPLDNPVGPGVHVTDTRDPQRPRMYDGAHRRRNGTSFPVEVAIASRSFGGRNYQLVVARDIKGRRRLEDAIRESEVIYRSLFELSHDAIYLTTRDGSVSDVNDSAVALFGYTREEFIGLPASRLYGRPEEIRAFQRAVDEHEVVRDLPVRLVSKNGSTIPGRLTATLRHAGDGSVLGYQCMIARAAPPPPARPVERDPAAPDTDARRSTVLVIEPDSIVSREAVAVLELAGIDVRSARSDAAALDVIRSRSGDVGIVVLNADGPTHDSNGLIDELRQVDPALRFVLMGNDVTQQDVDQRVRQGVVGFVRTPIYPLALVEHVRRAMRV